MATSALVCINLKTRRKGGGVEVSGGDGDSGVSASTQQLVQALVDNGIIQLSNKATIRVVDGANTKDEKPPTLGSFALKPPDPPRPGGIIVEAMTGGDDKMVKGPIVVQRNVYVGGTKPLLQLLASSPEDKLQLVQLATTTPAPAATPSPVPEVQNSQPGRIVCSLPSQNTSPKQQPTTTSDGEPIKLPENLESLPKADHFPAQRHRWNTNEEIAAILITFERHLDWQSKEVKIRPKSGSMLLYSRKKVRYRRDGYCWKKRKDGKTTREDHMKLKVQGTECIYGCYVHSAILPTFHRRCYWLLQNPDIVLVHYLNVPYPDDNKLVSPTLSLCADKKQWTKEELISQLKPMFYSEDEPEFNNELEISTAETVETIVSQLLERQRSARASAICKQLECGCPDSTCTDAKTCAHPIRRIQASSVTKDSDSNQVSSTTGPSLRTQSDRHLQMHTIHQGQVIQSGSGGRGGPLVLNLSQIQTGGLLILNPSQQGAAASQVQPPQLIHRQHPPIKRELPFQMDNSCQVRLSGVVNGGSSGNNSTISAMEETKHEPTVKYEVKQAVEEREVKYSESKQHQQQQQFYHTLDLTQEDIHQTLSANMPLNNRLSGGSSSGGNVNVGANGGGSNSPKANVLSGLDEIDFIDVNAMHHDDDVLVNLDAFDMLSDFPDLDGLDGPTTASHDGPTPTSQAPQHSNGNGGSEVMDQQCQRGDSVDLAMDSEKEPFSSHEQVNITDFSPDWAYTDGGVKVLVTGPWYSSSSNYSILFDSVPVPTTLVQSGVLRCYCPAHEVGFVSLQVAYEGVVVSNSEMFEYKKEWGSSLAVSRKADGPWDGVLRLGLVQRFDWLASRLGVSHEQLDPSKCSEVEERLVNRVDNMAFKRWNKGSISIPVGDRADGMTALHLAAALGYSRLILALIKWKTENPNPLLETEVDSNALDAEGKTPLMRACLMGRGESAELLAEWEPAAAQARDREGRSAVDLAAAVGHSAVAAAVAQRLRHRTHLAINKENTLMHHDSSSQDNVFIHPSDIHRNGSSMELHVNIPLSMEAKTLKNSSARRLDHNIEEIVSWKTSRECKRPSIDSGVQSCNSLASLKQGSIYKTSQLISSLNKPIRFERSMSLPVGSPVDGGYETSSDQRLSPRPLRMLDFTMCGQGTSSSSPIDPVLTSERSISPISSVGEQDARVLTLAEQIIAAMPERIKNESDSESMTVDEVEAMSLESPLLEVGGSCCCLDTPPHHSECDIHSSHQYRYYDVGTPCSSPASCLPSPLTASPPPTTADFTEFLHAGNSPLFEKDFSNLTLSDREQRELYEAAKVIQKAYRSYKGRKKSEQDKERQAAVIIQNCYRRYKQYVYFKQMTHAAMVIQSGFRSYCENKKFKKSQESMVLRQSARLQDQQGLKSHHMKNYTQRRQNQAARKIQQFMRQSKNKLERERAEREKQGQ